MSKRRLAAIMFTDVVGYTAMMEKNEQEAMEVLSAHKKDLEELSQQFNSEVVEYFGDGSLTLFHSVHDALGCARELQRRLTRDGVVPLRVGVHIGEVLQQDGKVFGDGVNVASRVESTGYAGTVLLSQHAHDKVKNQSDFQFQDLGEFSFKNVEKPMRIYGLVDESLPRIDLQKLNYAKARRISRTRTWSSVAMALVVLAVIAAGLTYWFTIGDKDDIPGAQSDGLLSMAVFPFEVSGDPDIAYLKEGLVDVVSTKIDGVAGFSAVDPNMTIGYYRKESDKLGTPADFAEAARALGAREFILGNVIKLGQSIRLKISQYSSTGKLKSTEEVVIGSVDEVLEGVDDLIRQTVASKLEQSGQSVTAAQAMFSSDIDALRYFLEGEEKRRQALYREASQLYLEALSRDSTMALTWLSLWQVCSWSYECSMSNTLMLANAEKFSGNLPDKYREYITASADWWLYRGGDIESRVRGLIDRYGGSTELYALLGEIVFHRHVAEERPATDALPYFLKAFEYDRGNNEVLNHVIQLLSYQRDTAGLEEIMTMVPSSSLSWVVARSAYLISRTQDWSKEDLVEIIEHPQFDMETVFALARSEKILDRFGRLFDDLEELNGQPFKDKAMPMHSIKAAWFGNLIISKEAMSDPEFGQMIKYAAPVVLAGLDAEDTGDLMGMARSMLNSGDIGPWPDDFQLALIAAYKKDEDAFNKHLDVLDKLSGEDNTYIHEELIAKGYWLHRQENYIASNEVLDSAIFSYGRPLDGPVKGFSDGVITLVQAENYSALGNLNKALLYYTLLTDVLDPGDETKVGFSWLRRGEILNQLGRDEEALQFFNYFLRMYSDCDPAFKPWVERAFAGREEVFSRLN